MFTGEGYAACIRNALVYQNNIKYMRKIEYSNPFCSKHIQNYFKMLGRKMF